MGYKVKRGSVSTNDTIKDMLSAFFKRLVVAVIILVLMAAIAYFFFQFAYDKVPAFAVAADDVIAFIQDFYAKNGILATLGLIGFVCVSIWALGEEVRRKEQKKEAMREMMK